MRITTLSSNLRADGPIAHPPFVTLPEESTQNNTLFNEDAEDNIGSLYYVVTVIFIYGFSIVLMIASHIRKNQQDNQLRTYLKEMALLRKKDRREKIMGRMTTINTTNIVCSNLHNAASATGALTTTVGSGHALLSNGNGISSRGQQPFSGSCTYAHMNIGSCTCAVHAAIVNAGQNTNAQNITHSQKNNLPSFQHDCIVNYSPLVPAAAQPSTINGSSLLHSGSVTNIQPAAPLAPVAISNNSNNNSSGSSSSSSSSSNSSSVSTNAIITSNSITSPNNTDTTIAIPSTSTCDSSITTGSSASFAESQQQNQQQHYMNNHHKVDEAQEIMLLQAQLTQIQYNNKQQQQQQQLNNCCLGPISPLDSSCANQTTNRAKSPIETNIQIISENVIT